MRRIRSQLFLAVGALLAAVAPSFSQTPKDPVSDLTGNWDVQGNQTTIFILPDQFVMHSRWGRGDIKWENAAYYTITYRERSMTCHYLARLGSSNELSMLRYDSTDTEGCDLGEMRRLVPWKQESTPAPPLPNPNPTTSSSRDDVVAFLKSYHIDARGEPEDLLKYYSSSMQPEVLRVRRDVNRIWPIRNYEVLIDTV